MRCLLVLSVLVIAALCQSCTKQVYKCVNQGTACATVVGGSGAGSCDFSDTAPCTFCKKSVCDSKTFVCQGIATKGSACTDVGGAGPLCLAGQDHAFPDAGLCMSSKCGAPAPLLYAGDACSTSDPLINTASTTGGCVSPSSCGSDNTCTGSAVGGNCSLTIACAQGAFCNASTCAPWVAAGGDCSNGEECTPDSICTGDPTKKTCVAVLSVAAGGNCDPLANAVLQSDAGSASILCVAGTACITDTSSGKSTCQQIDDGQQGKSCSDSKPCTAPFQCFTNPCTSKSACFALFAVADSDVASAYSAYLSCLKTNNCDGDSTPWDSGAGNGQNCAFKNCNSQWGSYIKTIDFPSGDCPTSSSSASTVVVATTLVAAAAAIALL